MLSIWYFDNGASSKIDDVLAEAVELLHVLPLAVHLKFFWQTSRLDHSETFSLSEVFCGTPPSCLKVVGGWVVVVGGLQDFSVSPIPLWVNLGFKLGWNGLGLGLGGSGHKGLGLGTRA